MDRATKVILEEIKTFDFTDHVEEAEVMVLKQSFGIFFLEARFSMKNGENITKIRSESLIRIKKKLNEAGIELATQSSTDPTNN